VLRFRYTTYMGELHPAAKKVVVEFSPADLKDLTDVQRLKLKKLAGARYNPEKDIIKMSCERFEHQAQNKRYLGDLVKDMITAAKVRGVWPRLMVRDADTLRTPLIPLKISPWTFATTSSKLSPSFRRSGS
jgi:hypothetical protein